MHKLTLIEIGDSLGAILPDELLTQLGLKAGDELRAAETPDGYILTPGAAPQADEVQAGREFMADFSDTFGKLAK
jgi:antitoxin component of MazEF toxin-antitoxin module